MSCFHIKFVGLTIIMWLFSILSPILNHLRAYETTNYFLVDREDFELCVGCCCMWIDPGIRYEPQTRKWRAVCWWFPWRCRGSPSPGSAVAVAISDVIILVVLVGFFFADVGPQTVTKPGAVACGYYRVMDSASDASHRIIPHGADCMM